MLRWIKPEHEGGSRRADIGSQGCDIKRDDTYDGDGERMMSDTLSFQEHVARLF